MRDLHLAAVVTVTVKPKDSLASLFDAVAAAMGCLSEQLVVALAPGAGGAASNRLEACEKSCAEAGLVDGALLWTRQQETLRLRQARADLEALP